MEKERRLSSQKAHGTVIPAQARILRCFVVKGFRAKPGMTNVIFGRLLCNFEHPHL
jgi:hypothetical protein